MKEHSYRKNHVNLLLLDTHYCHIRNYRARFVDETWVCVGILELLFIEIFERKRGQQRHDEHVINCLPHSAQNVKLPDEQWILSGCHTNCTLCHRAPYTVFVEFESFIVPTTNLFNLAHYALPSFWYLMVDCSGKTVKEPVIYRGKGMVDSLF